MACHGVANKIVGPGYNEVVAKYKGQADAEAKLVAKVKAGGQGVWGASPHAAPGPPEGWGHPQPRQMDSVGRQGPVNADQPKERDT
jgi:hypothetical protein